MHRRPTVPVDVRTLIRTMAQANPRWGAPRIHGELLKLGIDICQATVAKYMGHRRQPHYAPPFFLPLPAPVVANPVDAAALSDLTHNHPQRMLTMSWSTTIALVIVVIALLVYWRRFGPS